jgi:hypothetical protein
MSYREIISEAAADVNVTVDPRHVEAWMRSVYNTLGHLDMATFRKYCRMTAKAHPDDIKTLESLAQMDNIR